MQISHSKKFIFIHVYKVAGTSIRNALRPHAYFRTKKNLIKSFVGISPSIFSGDIAGHAKAKEIKEILPVEIFNSYFKFAFVRNPWEWQVSLYHFMKQNINHYQHDIIKNLTFDEYIDWRVNNEVVLQKEFLYDDEGHLLVDFVGKLESIDHDFRIICDKLNIYSRLEKKNQSSHTSYRNYYSESTRNIIAEAYSADIMTFNYSY